VPYITVTIRRGTVQSSYSLYHGVNLSVRSGETTVFVVVKVPILDMRAKPRKGSERVSQARLGDNLAFERKSGNYLQVRSDDGYEGWVSASGVTSGRSVRYAGTGKVMVVEALFEPISSETPDLQIVQTVPMGSVLRAVGTKGEWRKVAMPDGKTGFARKGEIRNARNPFPKEGVEEVIQRALSLIGTPYLWGGTTPWGLDCSGLAQLVYRMGGYQLLRDADMQFEGNGRTVSREDRERGDLLFFRGRESPKISHVAMCLDKNLMIHASGSRGVVVEPTGTLDGLLVGVKRIARSRKGDRPAHGT